MLLLRDNSLRAWRSPVDILSFGLSNSILASSNFTSSRKISRATDGWTGGARFLPREKYIVVAFVPRGWRLIRFSFVTGVGINFFCLSVCLFFIFGEANKIK